MSILKYKNKYYFFKKWFTAENIRTAIFCIIIFVLIIDSVKNRTFNFYSLVDPKLLFSIIILFFSDWIARFINTFLQNKYEDEAKLTSDYYSIVNKYKLSNLIKYEYDGKSLLLPYEQILKVNKNDEIHINDKKDKMYELPKQVCNCSSYIFEVHIGSIVYNNINIRLDNLIYHDGVIELFTSRTHYYDSLITNRACDLVLKDGRSIREIFEPGPYFKAFNQTKMSNHIGFNGMVVTKDGYIPLIKRGRNVSIAKGVLSSSISASLKTKYAVDNANYEFTIHGLANAIRNEIQDELSIDMSIVDDKSLIDSIKYFYRDLIECGKPQFFIYYDIPYTMEEVKKCFYCKYVNSNMNEINDKELKMKKDGNEILFFKPVDLFDSKLVEYYVNGKKMYSYDKLFILNKVYNITPAMLFSIQLLKNCIIL